MKVLSPVKSIRKHCLRCAERPRDVRLCGITDCYLYPFRMGKNPNRAGIGGRFARQCAKSSAQLRILEKTESVNERRLKTTNEEKSLVELGKRR